MQLDLGTIRLKSGETVAASCIHAPDTSWAPRIEAMLGHKGDPWTWQNSELLRQPTGLDARFFILHRGEQPFANIMVVDHGGVGLLGHVWTSPADRGSGASSALMELALDDFRDRGGAALYLGTDYDGPAWHYYRRRGFEPLLPDSGTMLWRPAGSDTGDTLVLGSPRVEPLAWRHWPASIPLFLHPEGGVVRLAASKLYGRELSEGPLIPLIRAQHTRQAAGLPPAATVLLPEKGGELLGLASVMPDPFWPRTGLLDLFCQPEGWAHVDTLVCALQPSGYDRLVAFADASQTQKHASLQRAGFRVQFVLPRWLSAPPSHRVPADVVLFLRD